MTGGHSFIKELTEEVFMHINLILSYRFYFITKVVEWNWDDNT